MASEKRFSIRARIKSFQYAFNGLKIFFGTEHQARIHALATILVVVLAWYFKISASEWMALMAAIAAVLIAEIFNTAMEKLADAISPDFNLKIKTVKDLAAGGVLIAAVFALVIGAIVFIPKVIILFRG